MQTENEHTYYKMEDGCQYTNNTQEIGRSDKCSRNTAGISKSNNRDKPMVIDKINSRISYFIPGLQQEADKKAHAELMQQLNREFKDVFTGIE